MKPFLPKSLILLLFVFLVVLVFSLLADSILAANIVPPVTATNARPQIRVNFGSFTIANFSPVSFKGGENVEIPWIGQYIGGWYRYLVGIAGILAVIMIMVGGVFWLTAGGSPDKIGKAKEYITGALTGLVLALFSYVLLYTINPRLIRFEPIKVQVIADQPLTTAPQCSRVVGGVVSDMGRCQNKDKSGNEFCYIVRVADNPNEICCCPSPGSVPVVGCNEHLTQLECESYTGCKWILNSNLSRGGYCWFK